MMGAQPTSHIQLVTQVPSVSPFLEEMGTECVWTVLKKKKQLRMKRQKRNKEDAFQSQKTLHTVHEAMCSIHAFKAELHK